MAKKFVPDKELLDRILIRYSETKNYSLVSREFDISPAIIKRLVQESGESSISKENTSSPAPKVAAKPVTASQVLAARREYQYFGPAPLETALPTKAVFYGQIVDLVKEYLNV